MKYNLAVPLDRFSKHLKTLGIKLSTMCLSNYVIKASQILDPIYVKLKEHLVNTPVKVIHADETELKVLEFTDRTKSYMFVYTTSFYDNSVYLYEFSEDRITNKTKSLLDGFKGILVCDSYPGYNQFRSEDIKLQRCLVHARRYYVDVTKTLSKEQLKTSKAHHVVQLMGKIFYDEKILKDSKKTIEEITNARKSIHYQEMIQELKDYVWSLTPTEGSLLDKAVKYTKNAWSELFTYINYGYVEPHNQIAERAIRPFTIIRKNSLFSKTENGANSSAVILSIIQTAKANGLVVEKYLTYLLENINTMNVEFKDSHIGLNL